MSASSLIADRPRAEIVRGRDPATGQPAWSIDRIDLDPRDRTPTRTVVSRRETLREVLADALALEKSGVHVDRTSYARNLSPSASMKPRGARP